MNVNVTAPLPNANPLRRGPAMTVAMGVAIVCMALVLAGFAKTFFLRPLFFDMSLPPLAVVHGSVMSLWLVLFITQVWLIASGRVAWHRRLGVVGMVLVPLVLGLGVAMAVQAMRLGHTPVPQVTPQQFLAVPLFNIAVFGALAGAGLLLRKRRDWHRRLMLLAMLCLLPPAIARIPQELDVLRAASLFIAIGLDAVLVIACAVRDWRIHQRWHPAFLIGGLTVILALPAALVASHLPWWQTFADALG